MTSRAKRFSQRIVRAGSIPAPAAVDPQRRELLEPVASKATEDAANLSRS
jgi:hypothetical protein